jgi:SAM-dependent methyltransferase
MERWHFWFRGRGILVNELMGRENIDRNALHLELGCGTGKVAAEMKTRGHRVVAVDLRPEGLEQIRSTDARAMLVRADATVLPFRRDTFDVITALDVIEHLDDAAALSELRRVIRASGHLILSVPAMQWLWSARDEDAGHLRRYTPQQLRSALLGARLRVVALRYYQFVLFPLFVVSRMVGKIGNGRQAQLSEEVRIPLVNRALGWVNSVEAKIAARVSLPWGSSLVAVCRPS